MAGPGFGGVRTPLRTAGSLSAAHTREDVRITLERVAEVVERMTREAVAPSPHP
jgi:hypothetical protein